MTTTIREETLRIAGERVGGTQTIEVHNPYTNEVVGTVPKASLENVRIAFEKASSYKATLTRYERSEILRKTAVKLNERRDEISDLITAEAGLCKKDTLYEVGRACDVFNLSAQLMLNDDSETYSCDISPHGKKRRIYTMRQPLLGVISAITPFNHPLNQVAHKVAPSIATNNRMVLKPSEKTPLTALLLADILYEAGLPPAMFSVITGDPKEIGSELLGNEHADLITFTGGVSIGHHIAENMGYRRVVLELGGNAALIVMEDADIDRASTLAVSGAYKNSGQRCTAVKRILVHESIAEKFVAQVVAKSREIEFGDPTNEHTQMGTVIDEASARYCEDAVNDAIAKGAELLYGHERRGALYSPTVLDRVPYDCQLVHEETFGPVAPIIRFNDIDEAIHIVNSTDFGLSSGVCTNRLDYITRFVEELQVGTVNVWEVPGYRIEMSPFGGIKNSGLGYKEGVLEAMKSFTNVKTYSLPWP